MNKNLKEFLYTGLLFGGLGPIVLGIVYLIIDFNIDLSLSGSEFLLGILSTYLIAFVQAGSSTFHHFETWSTAKSFGIQLMLLYFSYLFFYLVNSWLSFSWIPIIVFTALFVVGYLIIWLVIYLIVKNNAKKLNEKLD
jgi:hypothetical protein